MRAFESVILADCPFSIALEYVSSYMQARVGLISWSEAAAADLRHEIRPPKRGYSAACSSFVDPRALGVACFG